MCSDWKTECTVNRTASSSALSCLLPRPWRLSCWQHYRIKKSASFVVCIALTSSPLVLALLHGFLRDTRQRSVMGPGVPLYLVWRTVKYTYMYLRWLLSGEKAADSAVLGVGEQQLAGWKQAAILGVPANLHVLPIPCRLVESLLPTTAVGTDYAPVIVSLDSFV